MPKPSRLYESEPIPDTSPLAKTHYSVVVTGGLADVALTRTFKNNEDDSIEGVLTFPLPVHAVLYDLEARIDERIIRATAQPAGQARYSYEDSIADGRTTILHAEILRGIHQISVGQLHSGDELSVTLRFVIALSSIGDSAGLRIPTTVGDIYGDSQMLDCDDLVFGGRAHAATIDVITDSGNVLLNGRRISAVSEDIMLDVPIDIEIEAWKPKCLSGVAFDGRIVTVDVTRCEIGDAPLDAAILLDCSSSMNERWSHLDLETKHDVVCDGLVEASCDLDTKDLLEIWDFNDKPDFKGSTDDESFAELLDKLRPPDGGTEVGSAILAVLARRKVRDILLITDGKSHSLPVQFLARSGSRFSVVLIGEDSLEANVGHLSALTGGQLLVPHEAEQITPAVRDVLSMMRCRSSSAECKTGIRTVRGGMEIVARWKTSTSETMQKGNRAVAAYAASLSLSALSEEDATRTALSEGLVTHLTSLVMFDYEGATKQGTPHLRKIELSPPATEDLFVRKAVRTRPRQVIEDHTLVGQARQINWTQACQLLGNTTALSDFLAKKFRSPNSPIILKTARTVGLRPSVVYSGILAGLLRETDSGANQYFDRVFSGLSIDEMRAVTDCSSTLVDEQNASVEAESAAREEAAKFKPRLVRTVDWAVLLGRRIDWKTVFEQLRDGQELRFSPDLETELAKAAAHPTVIDVARRIGRKPLTTLVSVIGHKLKTEFEYAGPVSGEAWRKMPMEEWLYVKEQGVTQIESINDPFDVDVV